jgi:polyadenylate-binding protein
MGRVLYVRGFPSSFTNKELKAKLRPYGNIKKVKVTSEGKKVFGIVTFYHEDHANIAKKELHGQTVDGIAWYVVNCEDKKDRNTYYRKHQIKMENAQKTIYLRDFPVDLTEEKLREIFEKHGSIESLCINEKSAFVTFNDFKSCKDALRAEKLLKIGDKRVYVDKLKNKNSMRRHILKKKERKEKRSNDSDDYSYQD